MLFDLWDTVLKAPMRFGFRVAMVLLVLTIPLWYGWQAAEVLKDFLLVMSGASGCYIVAKII